jgi:beta-lactam-binding protein with PASTA domain
VPEFGSIRESEEAPAAGEAATAVLPEHGGERILAGRYRVGRLIGRGGMAEVHLGVDTRLGRRVAIKLLKSSLANDPTFRLRFRQEAQAAARMTHPTIVRVFDAGEETVLESGGGEAQLPFIVMEYVDGKLLKDLLKTGPMTAAESGHILAGILTALEYSHRAGVVHRDIKPGNVMVTRAGQVKVMDFGIARAISDSSATVAQTTAILGTAQYFSPEQAKGETVDARSDLYSTGVVLYEMLTGRPPFRADSPVAVAYQHVSEQPRTPSELNEHITEEMDSVVLRALAKDREDRYQSAVEFRDDLDAVVAGRKPAARLPSVEPEPDLFGGAEATPETTLRQLAFDSEGPPSTSTRPPAAWVWAGVLCVVVVVGAVAVWVIGVATGNFGADARTVPAQLVGAEESSAVSAVKRLGLVPVLHHVPDDTAKAGTVVRTNPAGGKRVDVNTPVNLWISTGKSQATVPTLVNERQDVAQQQLEAVGLRLGPVRTQHSKSVAQGVVLGSTPAGGASVDVGTRVELVVSDGQVTLPDLRQQTIDDASTTVRDLGLQAIPQSIGACGDGNAPDQVLEQSAAGDVAQGSSVTLQYCDASPGPEPTQGDTPAPEPTETLTPTG